MQYEAVGIVMSELLTFAEAAEVLNVPESWLRKKTAAHSISCTRLGRHVRFTRAQLEAIVAEAERPAVRAPTWKRLTGERGQR